MQNETLDKKGRTNFRYSIPAAFLLPITLVRAFDTINQLPEAISGDTTFAWLPLLIVIPTVIVFFLLLLQGLRKDRKTLAIRLALYPAFIYLGVAALFPFIDGFPRTAVAILIWFFAMFITLIPSMLLIFSLRKNNSIKH